MTSMPAASPATVFLALWERVSAAKASARASATDRCEALRKKVAAILRKDDVGEVMAELDAILNLPDLRGAALDGCLALMIEIDDAFGWIHPRMVVVSPAHGSHASRPVPRWLIDLKSLRRTHGHYGAIGDSLVLPRGPLTRRARDAIASSADSVADRFAYLGVVPSAVFENGRRVPVRVCTIEADAARGAPLAKLPGSEIVGFIPIAEQAGDLVHTCRDTHGQYFVDFTTRADLDTAQRFIHAVERSDPVDIAVAPELVMPQDRATQLPNMIVRSKLSSSARPSLFVAGSGSTNDKEAGQSWNEGTVLNGIGAVLWKQRKVQQAGIDAYRARQFGLPEPRPHQQVMEDNASGDEVVIADITGFGRCVVLICQDLQAKPLSEEIVRKFQPDWVFVPILDPELKAGGWAHRRALELSSEAHARFVVATSIALERAPTSTGEPCCGLAVGPQAEVDGSSGRRHAVVASEHADAPKLARVRWNSAEAYWAVSAVVAQ